MNLSLCFLTRELCKEVTGCSGGSDYANEGLTVMHCNGRMHLSVKPPICCCRSFRSSVLYSRELASQTVRVGRSVVVTGYLQLNTQITAQ